MKSETPTDLRIVLLILALALASSMFFSSCSSSESSHDGRTVKADSSVWNNFNSGLVRTKILSSNVITYTILSENQSKVLRPTDTVYIDITTHKIVDMHEEPMTDENTYNYSTISYDEAATNIMRVVLYNQPKDR